MPIGCKLFLIFLGLVALFIAGVVADAHYQRGRFAPDADRSGFEKLIEKLG